MMNRKSAQRWRGVTLTELLVVLVIISLLATIAVPVYVNKVQMARIAIAQVEVREIAHAEEQCASIHGFYVPLQMLDDLPWNYDNSRGDDDNLNNEENLYLIYATRDINDQLGDQLRLDERSSEPLVERMVLEWSGPFLNPQRQAFMDERKRDISGVQSDAFVQLDFPLDPWGNPYRFFSPIGIIGTSGLSETDLPNQTNTGGWTTFSDGRIISGSGDQDPYDRFAVVSFGPDLLTEGSTGGNSDSDDDDIVYLFGGVFTESSFRAFY